LTKTIAIKPFWGVRGGTIHQKQNAVFSTFIAGSADHGRERALQNNYWGVGPRAGLDGEWHLPSGFGLIGKTAAALLYGHTQGKNSLTITHTDDTVDADPSASNFYRVVPNVQLAMGLEWQTCFWCEKMFYKVSAMWETSCYWNSWPTQESELLGIQGLTVNMELDF
jgi:hypothetical protein